MNEKLPAVLPPPPRLSKTVAAAALKWRRVDAATDITAALQGRTVDELSHSHKNPPVPYVAPFVRSPLDWMVLVVVFAVTMLLAKVYFA